MNETEDIERQLADNTKDNSNNLSSVKPAISNNDIPATQVKDGQSGKSSKAKALSWIPSLYLTEGMPYVIINTLTLVFYKQMGFNNSDAAFYTSWLNLPWVIKPFWSPFVDMFKTKRWWILFMQLFLGAGLASIGWLGLQGIDHFFSISLVLFWLLAFSSATHDIAADGFYILELDSHQQSFFAGIRNTFYRISTIFSQGILLFVVGKLANHLGDVRTAWSITFGITGVLLFILFFYHSIFLPKPAEDKHTSTENFFKSFSRTFYKFMTKKNIGMALAFILLFRLGEAQLGRITPLFMMDSTEKGGLGLSVEQIGIIYGTFGITALTIGGILGGWMAAKDGLKKWLFIMALTMNLPNIVYVYMSFALPSNLYLITLLVCIEQFGYGFGFTGFMLYLLYFSRGQYKTTYYAFCTGFMALGMLIPGLFAGHIQTQIGYFHFFIWVCICTIPGFIIVSKLPFDAKFGKKE